MACEVWGHLWPNKRILFYCDNMAVVHLWRSGLSKAWSGRYFLWLPSTTFMFHIAGVENSIADALSRFLMQKFHLLAPDADDEPTLTPDQLTYL